MTTLGLILANTTHRPLRTALSAGSLAVMSFMFVASFTLLDRTRIPSDDFPGPHLVVAADGPVDPPLSAVAAVKRLPGVLDVEYERQYVGLYTLGTDRVTHSIWGASDGFMGSYPRRVIHLSPDLYAAWKADRQGIVAGAKLAARYRWQPGANVVIATEAGKTVSGHYLGAFEGNYEGAVLHYDHAKAALAPEAPTDVTRMVVGCEASRCEKLPDEIDQLFASSSAPTIAMSQEQYHEWLGQNGSTIPDLCALVGFVIIALTAVITGCTLSISLRSRVAEIATLRALGFSRGRASLVLLAEAALVAGLGGLAGAFIPYAITAVHPVSFGTDFLLLRMVVPSHLVWSGTALAIGVGVAVALWPVVRTLRVSIVQGLA